MAKINEKAAAEAALNSPFLLQDFEMEVTPEFCVEIVKKAYGSKATPVDVGELQKFRLLDLGMTQEELLKNFFDPKGKQNPDGGKAEFFRTDFKPCPLVQSLNGITKNYIINQMADISVNGLDKLSVDKKVKKRQQDILKRYTVDLINFIGSQTGDMPFDYSTNLDKVSAGEDSTGGVSIVEQIRSELSDDLNFALLSETGALKDGVELSHEMMINHFLESLKFKDRVAGDLVSDIMKARCFSYRFYTSAMDGTPQIKYIDPIILNTSPFREKDASDMDWWYYEFTTTWGEYMKMIGGKISLEKNMKIYETNRSQFYPNDLYPCWSNPEMFPQFYTSILNTNIRLGYFEFKKNVFDAASGKYYDKTYKFYYLPITNSSLSINPEYILDLGGLQDMPRFGGMLQYSGFSLVLWRDSKYASWYKIQEPDLFRLNALYNQYLNTVSAIVPRGVIFAEETLRELAEEMLKAKEEYMNQNGQELTNQNGAYQQILNEIINKFIQTGRGIFKRRQGDADERQLDPPTFSIGHQVYDDLKELMGQMMGIYNMMVMSLGTNPIMLGQAPKQHQTLKGIELANQSSTTMLDELVRIYEEGIVEFGRRMIYYDQLVIKEFDKNFEPTTVRAEQMKAIIGVAGIGWQEIFEDMWVQHCTMTIQNRPSDEQRMSLMDYAMQLEQKQLCPIGTAILVSQIKNYKLAWLFVKASIERQNRIATENQMQLMERQGQMQQQAQQEAMAQNAQMLKIQQQLEAENEVLKNQLKQKGMSQNIAERGENKINEKAASAQIDIQKKRAEQEMEL